MGDVSSQGGKSAGHLTKVQSIEDAVNTTTIVLVLWKGGSGGPAPPSQCAWERPLFPTYLHAKWCVCVWWKCTARI